MCGSSLVRASGYSGLYLALADGWGEPVEWLRASEEYFHAQDVTRVAAACRALLRRAGAQVTQRRRGHDVILASCGSSG